MEVQRQQQDETSTSTEIEEPDQEEGIRASKEAISFMLNIGETFLVHSLISVLHVLAAGTENAGELAPPGADTSSAAQSVHLAIESVKQKGDVKNWIIVYDLDT